MAMTPRVRVTVTYPDYSTTTGVYAARQAIDPQLFAGAVSVYAEVVDEGDAS